MTISEWATLSQMAAMRLPGLPTSARGMRRVAKRDGWEEADRKGRQWRLRRGRGGGMEFHSSLLPAEARIAFIMRRTPPPQLASVAAARIARENDASRALIEAAGALTTQLAWVIEEIRRREIRAGGSDGCP